MTKRDAVDAVAENLVALSGYAPDCDAEAWAALMRKELMPIPRCDSCKHWDLESEGHWDAHECTLLSQDFCCSGIIVFNSEVPNDFDVHPPAIPAGATGGGSVETRPHFGCAQWEAK